MWINNIRKDKPSRCINFRDIRYESDSRLVSSGPIQVVKDIARQTATASVLSATPPCFVFFLSNWIQYKAWNGSNVGYWNRNNQICININYPHWQKSIFIGENWRTAQVTLDWPLKVASVPCSRFKKIYIRMCYIESVYHEFYLLCGIIKWNVRRLTKGKL